MRGVSLASILRAAAWPVVCAAVLACAWVLHARAAALGWPYPYSDEAAHILKTVELRAAIDAAPNAWRRLMVQVFSGDAYPNAVYLAALAQGAGTLGALRASTAAFLLVHLALALAFGRALWGAGGALAYAAMVGFTAYPLAFSQGFYLDVPLVAAVGAGALLLEASEGFRKPIPAILFVAVATTGLYTKWTWAVFCAAPCVLAALRALAPLPGWGTRTLGAAALLALVAGGAWQVRAVGLTVPAQGNYDAGPALALVVGAARALAIWGVVAVLGALWVGGKGHVPLRHWGWEPAWFARVRPFLPLAHAGLAFGLVGALAGPWYATVWPRLWERYTHEQGAFEDRAAASFVDAQRILVDLVPAGPPLLLVGLLVALVAGEGRLAWAARVGGGAAAAALVVVWLPADTRYLLPVLPLLAGAIVAGWRAASPWVSAPLTAVCLTLAAATAVGPLLGHDRLDGAPLVAGPLHGVNVARRAVEGLPVPVLVATPPRVDAALVEGLVDALALACADDAPCAVRWTPAPGSPLVSRALLSMLALHGTAAREVSPATPGAATVTGGLRCGLEPGTGTAAWADGMWTSAVGADGCRASVRR